MKTKGEKCWAANYKQRQRQSEEKKYNTKKIYYKHDNKTHRTENGFEKLWK